MSGMVVEMSKLRSLERRVADICGHLNVLHGQLVDVVADVLESGAWRGSGIQSPAHWLAWQSGLSPSRARQVVALAQRRSELPQTFGAMSDGELAVDQVAVVARHVPAGADRQACDLAKAATVSQLSAVLSRYRFDPDDQRPHEGVTAEGGSADSESAPQPLQQAPPAPTVHDRCVTGYRSDGRFYMHVDATAEDGAVIESALREAHDALWRDGHKDVTNADALLEVSRRSLGAITSTSRARLYKTLVHVDTNGGWLHRGPALPRHVVDKLLCDGVIAPVWETEGRPVNVGRSSRVVPEATRLVVQNRDRICRHPTCDVSRHLDIHHIEHWLHDGVTDTPNLVCLCGRHHDAHHRGDFSIEGDADEPNGLTFRDRSGLLIPSVPPSVPPTGPPPKPRNEYVHPLGERLHSRWLYFDTG